MYAYTEGVLSVYRGGSVPYSHFVCLFVCVRRILNCIFYKEGILTIFLYRRYLICIFYIEGIYFSSLHPINIEALCLTPHFTPQHWLLCHMGLY